MNGPTEEPEQTLETQPEPPHEKGSSVLAKMPTAGFALAPTNFAEAYRIAQMLSQSAFVPNSYRGKPNDCLAAMAYGQEVGLSPLQALQGVAVINGRPSLWGDALLGIIRANPSVLSVGESIAGEGENAIATCTIRRQRAAGETEETTRTFSVADAKAAGLWGKKGKDGGPTPWITYPKRMLQMRARSWAARDSCADILKGIAMAEEMQDIEPRKVTPIAVEQDPEIDVLIKSLGWKRAQAELERKNYPERDNFIAFLEAELAAKKSQPERGKTTSAPTAPGEAAPTPAELLLSKDQHGMIFAFLGALGITERAERLSWAEQCGVVVSSYSKLTEIEAAKLIDIAKKDAIARGLVNTTMLECAACGVKPDYLHAKKCPEAGA